MAGIIKLVIAALLITVVFSILRALLQPRKKPPWPPYPVIDASEAEMDRRRAELRDRLSHAPFGTARAQHLWARLQTAEPGSGLIHEFHRDYCGHGLIRDATGVILCEIQDGHAPGPAIATWAHEEDFVAFFARQSDFSCSGWDANEPVFHTDDKWGLNNQRLTQAIIDRFLGTR
jgi:hypothetical protein